MKVLRLVATAMAVCCLPTMLWAQEVSILRQSDPNHYDPHRSAARPTGDVMFMAGDTLVGIDYDMKTIVPLLAESWEVSPDGLNYTFRIRQGVQFCSGKELTAEEVAASYHRWLDPETGGTGLWKMGKVDSIQASEKYTLQYNLKEPFPELLYQMATFQHTVINAEQAKGLGEDFGIAAIDATGPYCFESWNPRVETVLRKHEGYNWGPELQGYPTAPQVDKVVWKVIPEENTQITALQVGQIDVAHQVPYWSIDELLANQDIATIKADNYLNVVFFGFKTKRPFPSDPLIRRAVQLAIDEEEITDVITFGKADPAYNFVSPNAVDFNTSLPLELEPASKKKAQELLEGAGWELASDGFRYKDGERLTLTLYSFTGYWKEIAEAAQGHLRDVGIELNIQLFDATVAWSKLGTDEYDLFLISTAYMTAGDLLANYFPRDGKRLPSTDYVEGDLIDLIEEGVRSVDDSARSAAFAKAQEKLAELDVIVPIYHENRYFVVGSRLKPFKGHGVSGSSLYKGLAFELK